MEREGERGEEKQEVEVMVKYYEWKNYFDYLQGDEKRRWRRKERQKRKNRGLMS